MKKTIIACLFITLSACAPANNASVISEESSLTPAAAFDKSNSEESRGIVNYVWEEPMADVVDVPPGLDPEGVYYRPAHKAVVEIRQGRWQHYE